LAKGSYVLQPSVITWPYKRPWFSSNTKPEESTQRWSKYRDLATELVYSDFAPFTLPRILRTRRALYPRRRGPSHDYSRHSGVADNRRSILFVTI
jgi:hypothetical protein